MSTKPEELVITKDAVLKAAEKCSTAKEVLSTLFPEVFDNGWEDVTSRVTLDFKTPWAIGPWIAIDGEKTNLYVEKITVAECVGPRTEFRLSQGKFWRQRK